MESTPLRTKLVSPKGLTAEKTQKSMLVSLEDEESRRLLVEIYPELKDATTTSLVNNPYQTLSVLVAFC